MARRNSKGNMVNKNRRSYKCVVNGKRKPCSNKVVVSQRVNSKKKHSKSIVVQRQNTINSSKIKPTLVVPVDLGQLPQFRYNRWRKHYSYIFGRRKGKYANILLNSDEIETKTREGRTVEYKHVRLFEHPNPKKRGVTQYVQNKVCYDIGDHFDRRKLPWSFHPFDRRKIKRIRKGKWPK